MSSRKETWVSSSSPESLDVNRCGPLTRISLTDGSRRNSSTGPSPKQLVHHLAEQLLLFRSRKRNPLLGAKVSTRRRHSRWSSSGGRAPPGGDQVHRFKQTAADGAFKVVIGGAIEAFTVATGSSVGEILTVPPRFLRAGRATLLWQFRWRASAIPSGARCEEQL